MGNRYLALIGNYAVIAILGATFSGCGGGDPEPEPKPDVVQPPPVTAVQPPVAPEPAPPPPPPLPLAPDIVAAPTSLNGSDASARRAGADLAVQLGRWLMPSEQIRKWVVLVDRAAEGELLSNHRPWQIRMPRFIVGGTDAEPVFSERNYPRYDATVNVLTAIPVEHLAYYLVQWNDLFEQAYGELGEPGSFQQRLRQALDQVLIAVPLTETPALVRPSVMYKYADVRLEAATDIQKLMWRMGPDNAARLQTWAQGLYNVLDNPPEYRSAP